MFCRLLRSIGLVLMLTLLVKVVQAQTWSEWFSQKKTQKKYLLEQLAALKVYAGYLKKGYQIGSSGLTLIKQAGKGELDLHSAFFSSLKIVSPVIKNNPKVAEIIQMQLLISKAFNLLRNSQALNPSTQGYINSVAEHINTQCWNDLETLLLTVTSGRVEMNDDERLARIDRLYDSMQEKKAFTLHFCETARAIGEERMQELKDIKTVEDWYEK